LCGGSYSIKGSFDQQYTLSVCFKQGPGPHLDGSPTACGEERGSGFRLPVAGKSKAPFKSRCAPE
jgi:hypothetical protein